jgi:hypothetical protein
VTNENFVGFPKIGTVAYVNASSWIGLAEMQRAASPITINVCLLQRFDGRIGKVRVFCFVDNHGCDSTVSRDCRLYRSQLEGVGGRSFHRPPRGRISDPKPSGVSGWDLANNSPTKVSKARVSEATKNRESLLVGDGRNYERVGSKTAEARCR